MSKKNGLIEDIIKGIQKLFDSQGNGNITKEKNKSGNNVGNLIIVCLVVILIGFTMNTISSMNQPKTENTLGTYLDNQEVDSTEVAEVTSERYSSATDEYRAELENELRELLQKVEGVGEVDLMIFFSTSEKQVYATNKNNSESLTEEQDVNGGERNITSSTQGEDVVTITNGNKTEALVEMVEKPEIGGVTVVAEGAENEVVRLRVLQAVTTLFGLDSNKVQVYPMNK